MSDTTSVVSSSLYGLICRLCYKEITAHESLVGKSLKLPIK